MYWLQLWYHTLKLVFFVYCMTLIFFLCRWMTGQEHGIPRTLVSVLSAELYFLELDTGTSSMKEPMTETKILWTKYKINDQNLI